MKPRTPKTKLDPAKPTTEPGPQPKEISPEAAARTLRALVERNMPDATAAEKHEAYVQACSAVDVQPAGAR